MRNYDQVKTVLNSKFRSYDAFSIVKDTGNYTVFTFKLKEENYRVYFSKTAVTGTERSKPQIRVFWDAIKKQALISKESGEKFFCVIHCSTDFSTLKFEEEFHYWDYIIFLESDFNAIIQRIDIRALYDVLKENTREETNDYSKIKVPDSRTSHVKLASAFRLGNLDKIEDYLSYYDNRVNSTFAQQDENTAEFNNDAKTVLYTGAPGTGKSYQLNLNSSKFGTRKERVTFYPTLTYGQFVGVFKPFPESGAITYRYIPGPFIKQLVNALMDEDNEYLLIIEELNRGNASAIFGDIFQLFDRDENGQSEYPIHVNYDLNHYFEKEVYPKCSQNQVENMKSKLENGLIFPSNFHIWATMNNADQGVLPMDTAFTRRWEVSINVGINDAFNKNKDEFDSFKRIELPTTSENYKRLIAWNDLRVFINKQLTKMRVPEDKLLGPYFISRNILQSSNERVTESFKDKVLSYLFEDAIKQRRTSFFTLPEERLTYSELVTDFERIGTQIFRDSEELVDHIDSEEVVD